MDKELLKNLIQLSRKGDGVPQIDKSSSVDPNLIQEVRDPRKDVINALQGTHRTMRKADLKRRHSHNQDSASRKKNSDIFFRAKKVLDKRGYQEDGDDIRSDTAAVKKAMRKFMGADSWGKSKSKRGSSPEFTSGARKTATRKERRATKRDLKSRFESSVEERMSIDPQDTSSGMRKDSDGKPKFKHRRIRGKRVRKMTSKGNLHDVSLKQSAKKKDRQASRQFRTNAMKGVIESLLQAGYPLRTL